MKKKTEDDRGVFGAFMFGKEHTKIKNIQFFIKKTPQKLIVFKSKTTNFSSYTKMHYTLIFFKN